MTERKTTVEKAPRPSPSSEDVKTMNLHERLWHVQIEAGAANGGSKAYNGTYAPRTAVWNDLLQPLFAKYHLLFVTSLHEYKTKSLTGDMETAPLLICSIIPAEARDDYKSPLTMRFHMRNGSEQDIGKQLTYYNRYSLIHLTGISVDKDPDDPDAPKPATSRTPRPNIDPRIIADNQNNTTTTNTLDEFE
jgi:hypothetical protein